MERTTTVAWILLAGSLAAPLGAQEGPRGPRLALESKEIDFGEVVQGRVVELEVSLTNAGDAPLVVQRVETSCGCTLSQAPGEPIAPGASAPLVLRFDSTERSGLQSVYVELYTNDPTQSDRGRFCTVLQVRGDVRTNYKVLPGGAFFGEFVRGLGASVREVRVIGQGAAAEGFSARLASALPDFIEATVAPLEGDRRGAGVEVLVRLLPHAPPGELHHVLELETDVAEQPRVRVPVVAIVQGRVAAIDQLQLFAVRRGTQVRRRVPLTRRDGGEGIPVRAVDTDSRYLDVALEEVSASRLDLLVSLHPQAPIGPFACLVRVHLDDPLQPLLEFPVYGQILPRVSVDPPALLLPARAGNGEVGPVRIRGGRVKEVRVTPEDLGVEVTIVEEAPDRFRLDLELEDGEETTGALVLTTDVPGEERVRIPVVRR